jgi:hypothetical protein
MYTITFTNRFTGKEKSATVNKLKGKLLRMYESMIESRFHRPTTDFMLIAPVQNGTFSVKGETYGYSG